MNDILIGYLILQGSYLFYLWVKNRLLSPIRHIPGPFLWTLSDFPRTVCSLRGRAALTIHSFREDYGDVVRVGPNTVVFFDREAMKKVYGHGSKFYKSEFYLGFNFDKTDKSSMATLANEAHRIRRSMHARAWTKSNMLAQQHLVQDKVNSLIVMLNKEAEQGQPVDIVRWFAYLAHDVMIKVATGQESHCTENGAVDDLLETSLVGTMNAFLSGFTAVYWVLSQLPIRSVQYIVTALDRLHIEGHKVIKNHRAKSVEDQKDGMIMQQLLEDAKRLDLPDAAIINEMFSFIVAGGDTTKLALTFFCYNVWTRPSFLAKLRAEVDAAMPNGDDVVTWEVASALPLLGAALHETIRLFPPVPGALPRYVPAEVGGLQIGNIFIPPGTEVATQPYSAHRDKTVYGEDAEEWKPERWLDPTKAALYHSNNLAFGQGQRQCIGMNLAHIELYLAACAMIRNFDAELVGSDFYKERAGEFDDFFTIWVRTPDRTQKWMLTRRH
ncbi:cytochrome P450 [Atractiella rhizophila]|nr:cytochrome P450 [Atractiella rhizophila]